MFPSLRPRAIAARLWQVHLAAPALLLAVAAVQLALTRTSHLSPWKGGGFGMFATLDGPGSRRLSCECIDAAGEPCAVYLSVPFYASEPDSPIDVARLRDQLVLPRPSALKSIAEAVLAAEVVPTPYRRHHEARDRAERVYRLRRTGEAATTTHLRAVRLGVWRVRIEPETTRLSMEPLTDPVEAGVWP